MGDADAEQTKMDPAFETVIGPGPIIAASIHAGSDLRPEVLELMALDADERLREEDPYTDYLVDFAPTQIVANRSRFSVDLNRERDDAVYVEPEDAWGLDLWEEEPPPELVERSLKIYDRFYAEVRDVIEAKADDGPLVVFDLHSYNHRRQGPDGSTAPVQTNPEINVGTGSIAPRFAPVVDALCESLRWSTVSDSTPDVRRNVKFKGGHFSHWINTNFPDVCAIAIEYKKVFMDEWTAKVDVSHLDELRRSLAGTIGPVGDALDAVTAAGSDA